MKLYFAGADCKQAYDSMLLSVNATNRLSSYYFINKEKTPNNTFVSHFLDSGAYSVSTLNVKINIDKYIEYISDHLDTYNMYATLDVIGDYIKTNQNTIYMEKKGLLPLPVFHYNSPKEHLLHLIDKYDYIALGGLVPLSSRKKILI